MSTYDNQPIEEIDKLVKEDLLKYGQDNPAPLSLTVIYNKNGQQHFRHYELGNIVGYVLFGQLSEDGKTVYGTFISEINEDDEFWFAPTKPMYMAAAWMNGAIKTFQRMYEWYHEHIEEGFKNGKWEANVIKEIHAEKVFNKDGSSACDVLSIPENN